MAVMVATDNIRRWQYSAHYEKLALNLEGYGVSIVVANVSRIDWLRNDAGLVDPNYWRGTLQPRPVLDWYFAFTWLLSYMVQAP